jgi:hypothetical protein
LLKALFFNPKNSKPFERFLSIMKKFILKLIYLFSAYFSNQVTIFSAQNIHIAYEAPYYEPKPIKLFRFLQEVEERDKREAEESAREFLSGFNKRWEQRILKQAVKTLNSCSTLESITDILKNSSEWIQEESSFKQTLIRKVLGLFIKSEEIAAKRLKKAQSINSLYDIYLSLPESSKTGYINKLYNSRFTYFMFSVFDSDEDEESSENS